VEGSDVFLDPPSGSSPPPNAGYRPAADGIWAAGDRVTWVAGLVLMLSSFMGWYSGSGLGVKLAVIGWHTGTLGKLVFFIGLAILLSYGVTAMAGLGPLLMVLGIIYAVIISVVLQALSVIFQAGVYLYATTGAVPATLDRDLVEGAFRPKG